MNYRLLRINSQEDYSIGSLFSIHVDSSFAGEQIRQLCYTLEDESRVVKVSGETRIPAGTYRLELRTEGGLTQKYGRRFPKIHKGMIWLRSMDLGEVPNFKWIYLHCGNDDEDTDGCILVGDYPQYDMILSSRSAYRRIYPMISNSIRSDVTTLEVIDYDYPPVT